MKLSEAIEKGIFRTKIYLGEFFREDKQKEWVQLREPTATEAHEAYYASGEMSIDEVMKKCIIGSSFTDDDGEEASSDDVFKLIAASASMYTKVLTGWQQSIPLPEETGQSSAE
ncbi:MAG: hypothetical protein K9L57_10280 [Spirochaetaceae bacterium]|nr:hypothetical protein [Spirochaetia bacterium]MCF7952010.1 hypothetical protein [Spirochaetaceae bacterium]